VYRLLTVVFAVSTAVLAVMYAIKSGAANEVAQLKSQLLERDAQMHTLTSSHARLRASLADSDDTSAELAAAHERIARLEAALAEARQALQDAEAFAESAGENVLAVRDAELEQQQRDAGRDFMSGLSKMMDSPEMQEAVRAQLLNQMINPAYGGLFKELGLDPGTSETLRNLIMDRQMVAVAQGMQAMNQDMDPDQQKALNAKIKADQAAVEEQIHALLGDEQFATYKQYQQTEQERMTLGQFSQSLGIGSEMALDRGQQEQLVDAMYEERLAQATDPAYVDVQSTTPEDFTDATVDQFLRQQAAINGRVRERAQRILSDEQYAAFERFQENLLRQQEMGMRVGLKMFESRKKQPEK
jgi:hypothetical protein